MRSRCLVEVGGTDAGRCSAPSRASASSGRDQRSSDSALPTELLRASASDRDRRAARLADAAAQCHANLLDAQAATRPVGNDN
jgi:hypothetical protein